MRRWLLIAALGLLGAQAFAQEPDVITADVCLTCHNDASVSMIADTPHGVATNPDSPAAGNQCAACHTGAEDHARRQINPDGFKNITGFGRSSPTMESVQAEACLTCHTRDVDHGWRGSAHDTNDVSCADCHSVHTRQDLATLKETQTEVCYGCHARQEADSLKPSVHPIRFGKMACTDCHNPHGSVTDALLAANDLNQLCYQCHAEKRGPVLWEHAPVTEDCSLCHESHGSIHPALLTARQPMLCQSCHSQAGHPSVALTTNSLPGGNPSALLVNQSCENCHNQVHGSNHPSGSKLMR